MQGGGQPRSQGFSLFVGAKKGKALGTRLGGGGGLIFGLGLYIGEGREGLIFG